MFAAVLVMIAKPDTCPAIHLEVNKHRSCVFIKKIKRNETLVYTTTKVTLKNIKVLEYAKLISGKRSIRSIVASIGVGCRD